MIRVTMSFFGFIGGRGAAGYPFLVDSCFRYTASAVKRTSCLRETVQVSATVNTAQVKRRSLRLNTIEEADPRDRTWHIRHGAADHTRGRRAIAACVEAA